MEVTNTPSEWTTQVRKRVRAKLAEHEITATEVARRLTWTQSYISRRLTAKSPLPFSVADLEAIAGVLGIPVTDLIPVDREPAGAAA